MSIRRFLLRHFHVEFPPSAFTDGLERLIRGNLFLYFLHVKEELDVKSNYTIKTRDDYSEHSAASKIVHKAVKETETYGRSVFHKKLSVSVTV